MKKCDRCGGEFEANRVVISSDEGTSMLCSWACVERFVAPLMETEDVNRQLRKSAERMAASLAREERAIRRELTKWWDRNANDVLTGVTTSRAGVLSVADNFGVPAATVERVLDQMVKETWQRDHAPSGSQTADVYAQVARAWKVDDERKAQDTILGKAGGPCDLTSFYEAVRSLRELEAQDILLGKPAYWERQLSRR